jgi:hypothetical protein
MKEDEDKTAWYLELGLYPGILLGFRTYDQGELYTHVLYFPFFELALSIYK